MFDMPKRVVLQSSQIVYLAMFLALVVFDQGFLSAQEIEPSRPNIIVMMADDMGWGSIDAPGFSVRVGLNPDDSEVRYQGTTLWETPNLAAMASGGLNFSRMYSQSPVCSPTRASVMTGSTSGTNGNPVCQPRQNGEPGNNYRGVCPNTWLYNGNFWQVALGFNDA